MRMRLVMRNRRWLSGKRKMDMRHDTTRLMTDVPLSCLSFDYLVDNSVLLPKDFLQYIISGAER